MAHVFRIRDGRTVETPVKNLGWLLRNAASATSIGIYANGLNGHEATLLVTGDGWLFYSPFASIEVLHEWLRRPSLEGIQVYENLKVGLTLRELRGQPAFEVAAS